MNRHDKLIFVLSVLLCLAIGALLIGGIIAVNNLNDQGNRLDQSQHQQNKLIKQVHDLAQANHANSAVGIIRNQNLIERLNHLALKLKAKLQGKAVNGLPGLNGVRGAPGLGTAGPAGTNGSIGAVGPPGVAGVVGQIGPAGPAGLQGVPGQTGMEGNSGTQGTTGGRGPQGDQGDQGPQGQPGATGPQGQDSGVGPTGPAGATGPPPDLSGKTATCVPDAAPYAPSGAMTCTFN
jgi:hypothetical protein